MCKRASCKGRAFALSAPHTPSATCEGKPRFNKMSNARQRGVYKFMIKNLVEAEGLIRSYTLSINTPYGLSRGACEKKSGLPRTRVRAQRPPHPLRYLRGEAAFQQIGKRKSLIYSRIYQFSNLSSRFNKLSNASLSRGASCRVYGVGCRVWGVESRVKGVECRVKGVGYRV